MNYEINEGTLAVISLEDSKSRVWEDKKEYVINTKAFDIMDNSCKYFGSSLLGRLEGTKNLIGVNYKSPVIIEEDLKQKLEISF